MDIILISIIICTYNNAESLRKTLNDLSQCVVPIDIGIELICVDNNSSDHTNRVFVEATESIDFECHYFFQSKQGLSHARNLGLSSACGEYVLFTDDDAKIEPSWISAYHQVICKKNPDCLYSRIEIIWDKMKPWWYLDAHQAFFVHLDYGNEIQCITDLQHEFFGKNFCVRRRILEEFGGFNPKLGRCGSKLIAGEETLIYKRLVSQNHKVVYFPQAKVGHRLKDREYEFENIKNMYSDAAYSLFHIAKMTSTKTILGRPIYPLKVALIQLPKNMFKIFIYIIRRNKVMKAYHQLLLLKYVNTLRLWVANP